jgi:hypothetical protein
VAALGSCERRAQVTVVRRAAATRLEGSTTAWLDSGQHGLWRVNAPKLASSSDVGEHGRGLLDATTVTLCPRRVQSLIDEIMEGFPTSGVDRR